MLIKQGDRLINARNWSELVQPGKLVRDDEESDAMHGRFVCEPLERGFAHLLAGAAVLTGSNRTGGTIHGALGGEAAVALQEELGTLAAANAAFGFCISCH